MAAKRRSGRFSLNRARLVLLGVALAGLTLLLLVPDRSEERSADDGGRGTRLLEIELATFDGAPARLADLGGGKAMVVNFFASWCGPCVREMPDFEEVHGRRGAEVRFVGINLQDSVAAATQLIVDTGVTYDVVRDERGELFRAVDGFGMPTTVFLSAAGDIVDLHSGELSPGALETRIDDLLGR